MLQLIVLGQVPGTHLQITFTWSLVMSAIALVVEFGWLHFHHETKAKSAKKSK